MATDIAQQYITADDLKLFGFIPDEQQTKFITEAIIKASTRVNTISGNRIDETQFDQLSEFQQSKIKLATCYLTRYILDGGLDWLRGQVSLNQGQQNISQSFPEVPDYIMRDVYDALQQAQLYKPLSGAYLPQYHGSGTIDDGIYTTGGNNLFIKWFEATATFIQAKPDYFLSSDNSIDITFTPVAYGANGVNNVRVDLRVKAGSAKFGDNSATTTQPKAVTQELFDDIGTIPQLTQALLDNSTQIGKNLTSINLNSSQIQTLIQNGINDEALRDQRIPVDPPISPTQGQGQQSLIYDLSSLSGVDFDTPGLEYEIATGDEIETSKNLGFVIGKTLRGLTFKGKTDCSTVYDPGAKTLTIETQTGNFNIDPQDNIISLLKIGSSGGGVVGADKSLSNLNQPDASNNIISRDPDNALTIGSDQKLKAKVPKWVKVFDQTNFIYLIDAKAWSGVIDTFTDGNYKIQIFQPKTPPVKQEKIMEFTVTNGEAYVTGERVVDGAGAPGYYSFEKSGVNTYKLVSYVWVIAGNSSSGFSFDTSTDVIDSYTFNIYRWE